MPEPPLGRLFMPQQIISRKHRPESSFTDRPQRTSQLHHLYEQSCDARPRATALVCGSEQLSYAELDARANQVARYLVRLGVRPGDRVGLLYDRSISLYVALLGTLKCGAAFVPLDPSFPADRVGFIADDASLRVLLTTASFEAAIAGVSCRKVFHDRDARQIAFEKTTRLEIPCRGDALCYIIYTSGTTGRPKGVAVNQSNICQFLKSCEPIYGVTAADRVYQGMTIAFDFSIEEIWPTFKAGATLVAGPNDHRRFGAGLNDFLIEQRISVVCCVPTLLATLERDVPSLRLLLVGGEACPSDLVKRWSRPGRRMLNTYGPTEATVTATWCELLPDRPVTIGRPFPTSTVFILDDALQPVLPGRDGEICIGGPCVAAGYVNRPDLTQERFVPDPFSARPGARLYRTGDLGRVNPTGEIEYLGRIDTQVKIRGMRVELGEIEAVILQDPAVLQAVVTSVSNDSGAADLTAYIVSRQTGDFSNLRQQLQEILRRRLPAYMIPAFIEPIVAIPMLPSQKADRTQLPRPAWPRIGSSTPTESSAESARTPIENEIAAVWARIFQQEIVSVEADFFIDLGGHSLFAALAVSALRERPLFRHLAIADLYANPTVRGLARRLEEQTTESSARPHAARDLPEHAPKVRHSNIRVAVAGVMQMGLLYIALIPWLAPTFLMILALVDQSLSTAGMIVGASVAAAAVPLISLFLPVAAKWLLLGRVRPGRYPLWGWFFCRWWLVRRLLQTAPLDLLAGSPILPFYLRLLGARIGPGCHITTAHIDLPDLIVIGPGTSVGYGVDLDPSQVADGWVHVRPLTIGSLAYVGTNAVIEGGAKIGDGACVMEQSLVANGQVVPANETWAGSPARRVDPDPQIVELASRTPARRWPLLVMLGFVVGLGLLLVLPTLFLVPGLLLIWGVAHGDLWLGLALTPLAGLLQVLATCAVVVVGKRLTLYATTPGAYPLRSWFGLRKWFVDRLMALSMGLTNSLYSTLYVIPFLRILGARIGARAEVSTVSNIDPDMLTLGTECFVADLAVIGAARAHNGFIALGATEIGERGFIGNAALVPGNTKLPHDCLIGVLTVPPSEPAAPGSSWLGSPAIFLPRRQASEKFDESLTYRPPVRLVACRLAIEFLRVILPATLGFAALFLMALAMIEMLDAWPATLVAVAMPAVYLGAGLIVTLAVVALKWAVVAHYRLRVEPQWSHFVWRTELITGLYENVAVPWVLHWLAGTPLMAPALRRFGARIGRRVYLESTFLTEFDLVRVGDDAAIAGQAALQTHLFEDRVMKMSTVTVGPGCNVGARSVVLYDTDLEAGADLDALSLVMKGERLPAGRWQGIPARCID